MQSSHHDPGFTVRLADTDAGRPTPVPHQPAPAHGAEGLPPAPQEPARPRPPRRADAAHPARATGRVRTASTTSSWTRPQRLHDIWGKPLDGVRFAVDEIPPGLEQLVADAHPAPMGAYAPATPEEGPVITLYRRVVEQACGSREELQDLVHDVVVEYTAEMLGVPPESLDPVYRRRY